MAAAELLLLLLLQLQFKRARDVPWLGTMSAAATTTAAAATAAASTATDALMMELASRAGSVDEVLRAVFGFLHRRTDLYVETEDPARAGMGFRPGEAERKVVEAFRAFPLKAPPPSRSSSSSPSTHASRPAPPATTTTTATSPTLPNGKLQPKANGGVGPNYEWTQTLREVAVSLPLPPNADAKSVACDATRDGIRVAVGARVLLHGKWPPGESVKPSETVWSTSSGVLTVELAKTRETWWSCALAGHPEIDTSLVDSTRALGDFDPETQAAIRKAMVEQQQKLEQGG